MIDTTNPKSLHNYTMMPFFIIGFLIWGLRSWKKSQVESPEFKIQTVDYH